jgi:hypothetical protein
MGKDIIEPKFRFRIEAAKIWTVTLEALAENKFKAE